MRPSPLRRSLVIKTGVIAAIALVTTLLIVFSADLLGPGSLSSGQRDRAAAIDGPTLDGGHLSLADLRGKPVFINIWASW